MRILEGAAIAGVGGFAGAALRWLCGALCGAGAFPLGTFIANMAGCLLIGAFAAISAERMRAFLITGFCGGFTTFSAFSLEMLALAQSGREGMCAAYIFASVLGGLTMVAVGVAMTNRILAKR